MFLHTRAVVADIGSIQPLNMDVSDMSKPVMEMIEFEPGAKTLFFVLDKKDGKMSVLPFRLVAVLA